jgi:hypothetical protein
VIVVPAVLVVAGAVAFFALRDGGGDGIFGGDGGNETIPTLELKTTKATAVSTTTTPAKKLEAPASTVAKKVAGAMNRLYTAAFLDPANWRDDSYDGVWAMFDQSARGSAQRGVDTLTLGSTAGDTYDSVTGPKGKIEVKVLMNEDDQPATAVATVQFTARATGKDGTETLVVSEGQYFLNAVSGGWAIYSFSVRRDDHEIIPKPEPSGSPSVVSS